MFNIEFGLKGLIRSGEKTELNFCWIHPSCVTLCVVSRLGTWSHHWHTELTQEGEINAPINAERSGTRFTWYGSTFLLVTQTVGSRHPQQWIILNNGSSSINPSLMTLTCGVQSGWREGMDAEGPGQRNPGRRTWGDDWWKPAYGLQGSVNYYSFPSYRSTAF